MGIKIINSREYREKCEEIAFLQADVKEKEVQLLAKERELENKELNIKQLKTDIVKYDEENKRIRKENSELRAACDEQQKQIATLTGTVESMTRQLQENADLLAEKDKEIARLNEPKAAKPDVIDFSENAEAADPAQPAEVKNPKRPKKSGK